MSFHRTPAVLSVPALLAGGVCAGIAGAQQATFELTDSGQELGDASTSSVALADLNGDGDLDAVVGNTAFGPSTVWMNDGSGVFTDSGQELPLGCTALALGDLDGDGDVDLFLGKTGSGHQVWLNADNDGIFVNSGQDLDTKDLSNSTADLVLGDVDGDGDLDAVTVNTQFGTGGSNLLWINDGNGGFTDSGQRLGMMETLSVAMGDLDEDGDLDLYFGNGILSPSGISHDTVWLNDGAGTFTNSGQTLSDRTSRSIELGDVDGDGDLDVWVAGSGISNENEVWLNDGSGTFADSDQDLGIRDSMDVVLVDLEGDGDLDACVANTDFLSSDPATNTIWLNDGDGIYTLSDQTLGLGDSFAIAVGPLDSDSDPDVFVGRSNGASDRANRVFVNTVWGACCADIGCVQADEATCLMFGGTYYGGDCSMTTCTDSGLLGACCVDSGCALLVLEVCEELGGIWISGGDCGDCPEGLAEDIDNDGVVGGEDLARLLGAWGAGS